MIYGTSSLKLCLGSGKPVLVSYANSNMARDINSRRSTLGYLIIFGGGAIAWQSKLQKCVALSATDAEFIAITEACKEMFWVESGIIPLYGFWLSSYCLRPP